MLTSMRPSLCKRIPEVVSGDFLGVEEFPPSCFWVLACIHTTCTSHPSSLPLQTTHWLEILQALLLSPNQELQHRGAVVVLNMAEASKELAGSLMESEVLEILSVLAKAKEGPVARVAAACLGKAVEYGLIKPNEGGE